MIEMIVVLALVSILAGAGILGWKRLMWRIQAYGATDALRNAVLLARSDAVTRKRHSGILIDRDSLRYLRFVDSSATGAADGRYAAGERLLHPWTPLPKKMIIHAMSSSISSAPTPRPCGKPAPKSSSAQAGRYSIVFRPDGRSWATLEAKFGVSSFPADTFRIQVLPPTGMVQLEN